jgi:hypothetical protein
LRILLCIFFLVFYAEISAQKSLELKINCVDKESAEPIRGAEISVFQNEKKSTFFTNKNGVVLVKDLDSENIQLEIKHGFYQNQKIENYKINSNQELKIELKAKFQDIKSVNAYATGLPSVLYQSEKYSVSDFEVIKNGEIILLIYPKTLKKGSEIAILSANEIISRFEMPEKPIELIHDFRGNAHVVCENGVYGIHRNDDKIGISNIEKDYFMKYIFPIVDTNYAKYYFSNFNKNYPAFDYKIFDQLDSSYSKIIEIKDDLMMELYRSEIKWVDIRTKLWAKNLEIETGIDKEIWVGANYFTQSIYYKELYAPMFKRKDSIFVFDYYKDKLFTFSDLGEKLDSVSIFHHYDPKKTGWKKQVIQDKVSEEIYSFFEKDGICSLKKVNVKTGKLEDEFKFSHKYIDKIAVYDNVAYYIYRPYESAQKKYLYQVKLY